MTRRDPPSMCPETGTRPAPHEWRAIEVGRSTIGLIHGIEMETCDRCLATRTTVYNRDSVGRAIIIRPGDAN